MHLTVAVIRLQSVDDGLIAMPRCRSLYEFIEIPDLCYPNSPSLLALAASSWEISLTSFVTTLIHHLHHYHLPLDLGMCNLDDLLAHLLATPPLSIILLISLAFLTTGGICRSRVVSLPLSATVM